MHTTAYQIGDSILDNDDIFALFPLLHADTHRMMQLSKQTQHSLFQNKNRTVLGMKALILPPLRSMRSALSSIFRASTALWVKPWDTSYRSSKPTVDGMTSIRPAGCKRQSTGSSLPIPWVWE